MFRPTVILLLCSLGSAPALLAQVETGSVEAPGTTDVTQQPGKAGAPGRGGSDAAKSASKAGGILNGKMKDGGELTEEEEKEAALALERLSPEERLEKTMMRGARGHCTFSTSLQPERLMPGQTGTLVVNMIFQGDAVMPATAPCTVRTQGGPPNLTFGPAQLDPARAGGKLAKRFAGQAVYDNWATIRVPATLASTVKVGQKIQGSLELKFDLYSANTGQPIGRFLDNVAVTIEAGAAPDPVVVTAGAAAASSAAGSEAAKPSELGVAKPAQATEPKAAPAAAQANPQAVAAAPKAVPPAEEPVGALPPVGQEAGMPMGLIVGGALLLVALVALLLRRR